MRRSSRLKTLLYVFSLVFHGYLALRLLPALIPSPWLAVAMAFLLLAATLLVPLALIRTQAEGSQLNRLILWSGFLGMGWVSSLFVLCLLRDLSLLGLLLTAMAGGPELLQPGLLYWSAIAVLLGGSLMTLLGLGNVLAGPKVLHVDVPIAGLPHNLVGFRIAQITDIHVGPTIKRRYLQNIVDKVNTLQAEVIAITGDLVDGRVEHLTEEVTPLAQLKATQGTYFVTGNHEYYSNAEPWLDRLRELEVDTLMNEHRVLQHKDSKLVLAGIADYSAHQFVDAHRSDPHRAIANAPEDAAVRILLAHQPRSIFQALDAGYHLQLSGHTHGGQFWPWNLFVPMQQPFTAGLHWHHSMWIYTSRGTGYWGPPKRFAAPAEITLLTLTRR